MDRLPEDPLAPDNVDVIPSKTEQLQIYETAMKWNDHYMSTKEFKQLPAATQVIFLVTTEQLRRHIAEMMKTMI